jgi:glycosyltransferase involved in cell wall biosynthesis
MSTLRIAVTADPYIAVPPKLYGGIERIIDMLVRGLTERGHEVTLFAHPESDTPCRLEAYPVRTNGYNGGFLRNLWRVSSRLLKEDYDIIHSFGRLAYLLPVLPAALPKLMSYQRLITRRSVEWGERLAHGTLHFSGCSRHLIEAFGSKANWHVVYNGVPLSTYTFQERVAEDAPLVLLGRVEEIKGPHLAIEVARRSGRKLIIAGNVPEEPKHRAFFEAQIAPRVDGKQIEYIGPVNDSQKNDLLGGAVALLMPILWDEPFGIVMAEALACGTPVLALNRGSAPEIVENQINGFVCESVDEMARAVARLAEIDRATCRAVMEKRFSDAAITTAYEELYFEIIGAMLARRKRTITWQESV